MLDLDNLTAVHKLDQEGMLGHIGALAGQCRGAWAATQNLELPDHHRQARAVLIAGMGGSAIGGDMAAAVVADTSPIPITVHRGYTLPAHVDDRTLVIGSSYSGNTEETLSVFEAARERGCPLAAVTTGGKLTSLANEWGAPVTSFDYQSQPRAAFGYMFVSLLGILQAAGIGRSLAGDLEEAVALLDEQRGVLGPDVPRAGNRAKNLAVELSGKVPVVVGAEWLAPAARRWKTQFNENSKGWAYFEVLPEMDHNATSGIHFPAGAAEQIQILFLHSGGMHPRNEMRFDLTQEILEGQGVDCHRVPIPGEGVLAQMLAAVQLGDYVSTYLALLNGTDPTAITDIVGLKQRMSGG